MIVTPLEYDAAVTDQGISPPGDVTEEDFWDLVEPLLASGEAETGTMMGTSCLRADGEFAAMFSAKFGGLIVKLPRDRVAELIESGVGEPFAPAGKVFKEWTSIADFDDDKWFDLISESCRFVSS
jgi:hypothetical protein